MGNKKVTITVQVRDDSGFSIECSRGLLDKRNFVAETVDSLVQKTSGFLRSEFARDNRKEGSAK